MEKLSQVGSRGWLQSPANPKKQEIIKMNKERPMTRSETKKIAAQFTSTGTTEKEKNRKMNKAEETPETTIKKNKIISCSTENEENIKRKISYLMETSTDDENLLVKLRGLIEEHGAATEEKSKRKEMVTDDDEEEEVRKPFSEVFPEQKDRENFPPFSWRPSCETESPKMADYPSIKTPSLNMEAGNEDFHAKKPSTIKTKYKKDPEIKTSSPPSELDIENAMHVLTMAFGNKIKITESTKKDYTDPLGHYKNKNNKGDGDYYPNHEPPTLGRGYADFPSAQASPETRKKRNHSPIREFQRWRPIRAEDDSSDEDLHWETEGRSRKDFHEASADSRRKKNSAVDRSSSQATVDYARPQRNESKGLSADWGLTPRATDHRSSSVGSREKMRAEHAQYAPAEKIDLNIDTSHYRYALTVPEPYCEFLGDLDHGQQQRVSKTSAQIGLLPAEYIKLKLDGTNLIDWSQQLQVIYLRENFLFFIKKPPVKPWTYDLDCLHHKAYYILIATISPSIYPSIQHHLTVFEIYQKMFNLFHSANAANTSRISRDFHSAKLKSGASMSEHILNLNATRAELIQRGENISEGSMKSIIINSLDHSWDNYITILDNLNLQNLTLDALASKLIAEDNLRRERNMGHRESKPIRKVDFQDRNRPIPECHRCGSKNHYARDCTRYPKYRNTSYHDDRPYKKAYPTDRYSPDFRYRRRDYSNPRIRKPDRDNSREHKRGSMYGLGNNRSKYLRSNIAWLIDSGATNHTTHNKSILNDFIKKHQYINMANQEKILVKGSGNAHIKGIGKIEGVLYIPEIPFNILSAQKLSEEKEITITFHKGKLSMHKDGENVGNISIDGGLYFLNPVMNMKVCTTSQSENDYVSRDDEVYCRKITNGKLVHDECAHLLHRKLGHASFPVVQKMLECSDGVKVKNCNNYLECSVCKSSKLRNKPRPRKSLRTTQSLFQLVHMDVVGPFKPSIIYRKKYFLTIVDDYSRYGFVYTLNNKSEVPKKFREFYKRIETQHNIKIKQIMTDRGSEFLSNEFTNWLKTQGILHYKSSPFSPFQNGVVERKNSTLQTMVKCALDDAGLGQIFWAEALTYSNYTLNRIWSSVLNKTPYEVMYSKKPKINHLHVFGVTADVYIPKQLRHKGEKVSKRLRFMGYESGTKGYRFIDKNNRFVIARTATFHEHSNWSKIHLNEIHQKETKSPIHNPNSIERHLKKLKDNRTKEQLHQEVSTKEWKVDHPVIKVDALSEKEAKFLHDPELKNDRPIRTTRGCKPKYLNDYILSINLTRSTPNNYEDILKLPKSERELWEQAMAKEMDSLKNLQVYSPAEPPAGKSTIGTRWIFKIKELEDNKFLYKARLVAQGFAQKFPEDYIDSYSPTVRSESVKSALTIASILDLEVYQFDVQTAYLHANLDKEIYVRAPPGKNIKKGETWLLRKSLYGLKQSGKRWYDCITKTLNDLGFKATTADLCFFVKKENDSIEYVLIYVDDILYFGKHKSQCEKFAERLNKQFTLKILGKVNKYLGVQINKTNKGFKLSQKEKISDLLMKCNMTNSKGCDSPMVTDFVKNMNEEHELFKDNTLYRSIIGSLLYISNWTRPDITLAVNLLSRHVSKPNIYHWEGIKRVLRYLKQTIDVSLHLEPCNSEKPILTCYADADWAGDIKSRKSTSGYVFLINECPVYWYTGKQNLIATSTAEAEYICLSKATNNLTWFDDLLSSIWSEPVYPILINEDNKAAIDISNAEAIGQRSRHIDIKYKHVRQLSHIGFIRAIHCDTKEQIADILTKPLPAKQHAYLTSKLNVYM